MVQYCNHNVEIVIEAEMILAQMRVVAFVTCLAQNILDLVELVVAL